MSSRIRKAVGGLGMLVFLAVYAAAAVTLAGHLPENRFIQMAYFIVAGIAWGLPIVPLIYWMEKGR